jgi:transcriptional regulator with XRE-family HTH domain
LAITTADDTKGNAMSTKYPYMPDYAVSPGTTLKETLEEKGLSQADLALRTGMAEKTVSQIINGIAPISYETAEKFELVLGIPAKFWNARERSYREALVRIAEMQRLQNDVHWLKEIPLADLIGRGYVQDDSDQRSLVRQTLRFFGVSSVEAWRDTWATPAAQYRGSAARDKHPGYVAAWLRMGELQAESVKTEPFDAGRFKSALTEARRLTRLPFRETFPKLVELCATAGVVALLTKEIRTAAVSGAVRWLSKDRALIQLSLKYKSLDQLWFTFFHEAAHILLHGKKDVFIEYGVTHASDKEEEANGYAADILIPPEYQHRLPHLRTKAQICGFADSIGIAPGIVVRLLQDREFLYQSAFNDLKIRVEWK